MNPLQRDLTKKARHDNGLNTCCLAMQSMRRWRQPRTRRERVRMAMVDQGIKQASTSEAPHWHETRVLRDFACAVSNGSGACGVGCGCHFTSSNTKI
jgi:hypothetical protein